MPRDEPVERCARRPRIRAPHRHAWLYEPEVRQHLQLPVDHIRPREPCAEVGARRVRRRVADRDGRLQQKLAVVEIPEVRHHDRDQRAVARGARPLLALPLAHRGDQAVRERPVRDLAARIRPDDDGEKPRGLEIHVGRHHRPCCVDGGIRHALRVRKLRLLRELHGRVYRRKRTESRNARRFAASLPYRKIGARLWIGPAREQEPQRLPRGRHVELSIVVGHDSKHDETDPPAPARPGRRIADADRCAEGDEDHDRPHQKPRGAGGRSPNTRLRP
jgi:hypothetical protein